VTIPPQPPGDAFRGNLDQLPIGTPLGRLARTTFQDAVRPLSVQEVRDAEEIQKDQSCRYCGGMHARACPRVKRLSYDQTGQHVTEVEFWPWNEWPEGQVVFPEDLVEKEQDATDAGSGA
jgi:hypothetical protein